MLSSLPIELLRKIIESTVPHSFREETYGGRQTTLCTLSLVSRQFCAIAEPLLKEVIGIEYAKHLDSLRSGEVARISGGIDRVRWAAVDGDIDQFWGPGEEERTRLETLRRILALAEAVTLLGMLQDFVDFAWPQSTPLSNLTYLHLVECSWDTPPASGLTNLRSLALTHASFTLIKSILNPKLLPRLQNFAFEGEEVAALRDSKLDAMLPQLETLTFDYSRWSDPRLAFLHSAANKTLVDVSADQLADFTTQTVPISHMRFDPLDPLNSRVAERVFRDLVTSVRKPQCRVESIYLYLDSSFQPTLSSSPSTAQILILILFRTCRAHGIDVVIEESGRAWRDPTISLEFVRRQRAAKTRSMRFSSAGNH
ncbi:hypothetical protein JCM3766R1_002316 [Sporobolomyces carnicolor]